MAESATPEQGDSRPKLEYVPFTSQIDMPFYTSFFASKLEHDKLNDSARCIGGIYEPLGEKDPNQSVKMLIHSSALTNNHIPLSSCRAEGVLKNVNTFEEYKNFDKTAFMKQSGRQIWDAINDGSIFEIPSMLASFIIISYADLKKYRFWYHFAFPALYPEPHWTRADTVGHFSPDETRNLVESVGTWRYSTDKRQHGFFLAKRVKMSKREMVDAGDLLGFRWEVRSLQEFENGFFKDIPEKDRFIAFVDSSTFPTAPSWPIRNLLVLLRHRWKLSNAQILCYRDTQARRDDPRSIILSVALSSTKELALKEMPRLVGWEKNLQGKTGPRIMNLAEFIDPTRLADQAVDLNLKLMKWRISPNLDLDTIKDTKCLLLGAGTLGSYVSRNLMGWGIRKITFVDYGAVSFSNPVRQPLFTYEDCLKGGAPKATRAAEALAQINPSVDAAGHVISVPMLGHPILDEAKTKADYEKLEQLIDEHDAIFLLMDSRESRWLPTVMGKAKGKIVMNAALGFDTYVVMRHGPTPKNDKEASLGCYFCNDVVTPGNSQKDQTLDQQCTVTRPGVAAIASALLVELLTSILQHPLKHHAPAPPPKAPSDSHTRDPEDHPLGIVPHQIRGFLADFNNLVISGQSYPNCSACSQPVLQAWEKDKWEFVKKCLNDRDYVSEISGLAEIQRLAEKFAEEMGFSDEDDDGDDEAVLI